MDPSNYPGNVVNNNTTSYSSGHGHGHNPSLAPQTLPPLQPQNPTMQPLYNPGGSRTPATPNTPGSTSGYVPPPTTSTSASASTIATSQPPATRPPYQMMATSQYSPHQQQPYSSSMLPPTTSAAVSHPQPIAPAPITAPGPRQTSGAVPPALRPLASGAVMPQQGMTYAPSSLAAVQAPLLAEGEQQPTHVVGSQGRRGILPSAPGRPSAPPAGSPAKATVPVKDADGKFPCPHCTKTYLHAKHLKRHLLRHTGDRPYMCMLCRDTFSRSDILKRHFQKCSIRRGNPTGLSHLSHPQAHVKKSQQAAQKVLEAAGGSGDMSQMGLGNLQGETMVPQYDGGLPGSDDPNRDRRTLIGGSTYSAAVPTSMPAMNAQMASYNMPQGQNGMPIFTASSTNQEWSQMFQAGAQQTYVNAFPPNVGQTQIAIKPDPSQIEPSGTGGAPALDDNCLFFASPAMQSTIDPYQQLSTKIINFLSPPDAIPTHLASITHYFSPSNIKDFSAQYSHFHIHFTMIHIPTFRIMDAYAGLVAGMCCIGACYSDAADADQVQHMMRLLREALERKSRVLRLAIAGEPDIKSEENPSLDVKKSDIEELQAILLMQILFLWNGTPEHRATARQTYPIIVTIARQHGLLDVSGDISLYSPLHAPTFSHQSFDIMSFDWHIWIEQEQRLKMMFIIFLMDTALGLYFNAPSHFDGSEIRLPLPADDAAWEARTSTECAEALGLHGHDIAKIRNPDGSQRSKQPELNLALKALHSRDYQFRAGATNLYGKFIMIHALVHQLRRAQAEGHMVISNGGMQLSQNDWVVRSGANGHGTVDNSTHGTPVPVETYTVQDILLAVEKFKIIWDQDMMSQFPPSTVPNPRRYGFSRDAIHFYWVAKYLAKNTRPGELQVPAEQRFSYIISLLKSVKSWVMSDGAKRGEEMGSIADIDKNYGVADLTFDMTRLFAPIPKGIETPEMPPATVPGGRGTM